MFKTIIELFTWFSRSKSLNEAVAKRLQQSKTIKISAGSIFHNAEVLPAHSVNIGIFEDAANAVAKSNAAHANVNAARSNVGSVGINHLMSKEEQKLYDEVLGEFREIKPAKTEVCPYSETKTVIEEQITGDKLVIVHDIKGKYADKEVLSKISLQTEHGNLSLRGNNLYANNDALKNEFNTFLNGRTPDKFLFEEFVKQRNIAYIRNNGVYDLSQIRRSSEVGKEVERLEKQHHDKLQKKYEQIFKPYHTEQFYRIVGKDELMALLRGETIVSKNSLARYGRRCVDITTDGYYHDIFYGETKFRIPFIRKDANGAWHERLTSKIIDFAPERNHFQVPSYDYKDVELNNIKYWDGSDWRPVDINSILKRLYG